MCKIFHFRSLFLHLIHVFPLSSCWNSTHCAHYRWILNEPCLWNYHHSPVSIRTEEQRQSKTEWPPLSSPTSWSQGLRWPKTASWSSQDTTFWARKRRWSTPPHRHFLLIPCPRWRRVAFWAVQSQDLNKEKRKKGFIVDRYVGISVFPCTRIVFSNFNFHKWPSQPLSLLCCLLYDFSSNQPIIKNK